MIRYWISLNYANIVTHHKPQVCCTIYISGRKLIERSRSSSTSKSEDIHTLYGRQVRTAGTHREFPDIRISTQSAHRSATGVRHIRQIDTSGILHFSDLTRTSLPVYDTRPVSPPKYTVEDGVTDVIKVHITSSTKYWTTEIPNSITWHMSYEFHSDS